MKSKIFSACLTCCFGGNFESESETTKLLDGDNSKPKIIENVEKNSEKSPKEKVVTIEKIETENKKDTKKKDTLNTIKYEDFKSFDSPMPLPLMKNEKEREYMFPETNQGIKRSSNEKNVNNTQSDATIEKKPVPNLFKEIPENDEEDTKDEFEEKKETKLEEPSEVTKIEEPPVIDQNFSTPKKEDVNQETITENEVLEIEKIQQKDLKEEETLREEIKQLDNQLSENSEKSEKNSKKFEVNQNDVAESLRIKVESEREIRLKRLSELEEKRKSQKEEKIPEYLLKQRQKIQDQTIVIEGNEKKKENSTSSSPIGIDISLEEKKKRRGSGIEVKKDWTGSLKKNSDSPIDKKRMSGSPVPEKEEFGQHILKRTVSQMKKEEKKNPEWAIKQLQRNGEIDDNSN